MSDMEVREIKEETSPSNSDLAQILDEAIKEAAAETAASRKKAPKDRIVFEGPSKAQQAKEAASEKATPLVDAAGRPRWISTRTCYCRPDAKDECRFHSTSEPGWETCPSEPHSGKISVAKPRRLWHTNPDFGKPLPPEEVVVEEAAAEAAVAA